MSDKKVISAEEQACRDAITPIITRMIKRIGAESVGKIAFQIKGQVEAKDYDTIVEAWEYIEDLYIVKMEVVNEEATRTV